MGDTVEVTVVREHSGDAGRHPEKSTYRTTLGHARQLRSQGLVTFDDPGEKADSVSANKAEPKPVNKAEPKPRNKAATAPANKAEGKPLNKVGDS